MWESGRTRRGILPDGGMPLPVFGGMGRRGFAESAGGVGERGVKQSPIVEDGGVFRLVGGGQFIESVGSLQVAKAAVADAKLNTGDRKSTRLNSSHR